MRVTKAYCDTCVTCKRSKPSNQKPYGLLSAISAVGFNRNRFRRTFTCFKQP
ncbi:hypothetical protein BYT27DRAFT_7295838 [Phlegmacium glaucopus]|nr:hypothetical protein BYT27DRAFT_7295838 [Phlegmacium glaucopus]